MSLVIRTLSERIFEVLREQIVTGTLPSDVPIRQDALAGSLGVSKIPLREALARLEQEGLMTSMANRGYFVRGMSADEVDDIYALRLRIEPSAAAYAATLATDEDRAEVVASFERLDQATSGDLVKAALANRDFHTTLVRPGRRLLTTQMVERLAILAERYVIAHLRPAGRDARAHVEHRALLDAWIGGDATKVDALLTDHLRATLQDLRTELDAAASPLA